ncbi:LTA synthase family protein [Gilvimarinus agarilyticus]|nr:LTA synthase family protein [Gilvimarinus agarilyticus]
MRKSHLFYRCGFIACALLLLAVSVVLVDGSVAWDESGLKLTANMLPVSLAYLAALGLTRRPLVALILALALMFMVFAANAAKVSHLGEPVTFPDIFLIEQALSAWTLASKYISVWFYVAFALVLMLIGIGLYYERPMRHAVSWSLLGVSLLGFTYLAQAEKSVDSLYSDTAHGAKPWIVSELALKQGLIASLVTSARVAHFTLPPYDNKQVGKLVAQYGLDQPLEVEQVKPDIVLWLAESFFDPAILQGVDTCQFVPEYCELSRDSLVTALAVPTFGGNTTRTEFEVLTGIPFHSLGTQSFPYAAVVHDKFNSIGWTLAEQGYNTTAIHPHKAGFWQRNRALPLLGFERFIASQNMTHIDKDGIWPSDDSLADSVVQLLAQAEQPQFIFTISMEGHGPFDKRDVLDNAERDAIAPLPGLEGKLLDNWRQYIYHAKRSARAMQKIKAFVETRDRPTLVVYFGDHLPGLRPMFEVLQFKDGKKPYEQKTPAMAFANYELPDIWLPEASYELGLWALALSGQTHTDHYSQLAAATGLAKGERELDVGAALGDFRARQLYR